MIMGRILFLLLSTAILASATIRLYLKDGSYHTVAEYKILSDRVRFYSTERGDWEEMPLDLIDLKKTQAEEKSTEATVKEQERFEKEEAKAEADFRKEIAAVPAETGVYWIHGTELRPLKLAEQKIATSKKRQVLKVMSPIPMVTGKSTVELDGDTSAFVIDEDKPEFYFRLAREEQLAIFKLKPGKKGVRIVENVTIMPVTNEVIEEPVQVETFRRQVGDLLFRIWPTKPLEPGEYAVVEFSPAIEQGMLNLQVYDFTIKAK